jgi:hypothetical protein
MAAPGFLRVMALAAAGFSLAALAFLVGRTFVFGRREYFSTPRGYAGHGILYAFGRGMLDKESVTEHRPTMLAGLLYHLGVFAGLGYVLWLALPVHLSPPLWAVRAAVLAGLVAGLSLLAKRSAKTSLRRLSCPDDFFANLFVDLFLALALLRTWSPAFESVVLGASVLLFIYIPLGKIRHCFFFFFTRLVFGRHFGRRGALPGSSYREA